MAAYVNDLYGTIQLRQRNRKTVAEFDRASKGKHLPKRVKHKK